MSAIQPSLKTQFLGNIPVLDTGYVVGSPKPSQGIVDSPVRALPILNYVINGTYGNPVDARLLFTQAQKYMRKMWTNGPDGNSQAVWNKVISPASAMPNNNYHFMDYRYYYGEGTSTPRGYGIYMNWDGSSGAQSYYMGYRTDVSTIISYPYTGGLWDDLFVETGEPYEIYGMITVSKWQDLPDEERFYTFHIIRKRVTQPYDYQWEDFMHVAINFAFIESMGGAENLLPSEGEDPNDDISTTDPEGNTQETNSEVLTDTDDIDLPDITMYPNSAAAGLVTLYAPSLTLMQSFADELWQDNVWETIFQYFGKPSDAIVGMGVLPFSPPTSGYKKPKIGVYTCTTALPVVSNQYHEIDCGSLAIEPVWDSYLDYSPYTRISIYLPYVGTRELDVDEIMGHNLFVKYRVDCYNGNLVAFVGIDGLSGPAVRYQFSGNCMQQLPVNAQSFDAMLAAGVQIATALVGGIATGGAAAATQGLGMANMAAGGASEMQLAQGAANMALGQARRDSALMQNTVGSVMGAKPRVEKNGAIGASIGQMSIQKPFITRIMPNQSLPENYMRYKGYPLNATSAIGDNPGFTVVDDVRLNNLPATIGELDEIYKLLGEGVIV